MWWDSLKTLQQVCFIIGCVTALFMVIQIVIMLIGLGGDDTFEGSGDFDDGGADLFNDEGIMSGLKLLSVRSIVAFLCIGSWLTFTMIFAWPKAQWGAVLVGIAGGAAAGVGVSFAILGFTKLQEEGNIVIGNCVGKLGEVYLTVPAGRAGRGKVNVFVQEKLTEFEAVTDSGAPIKTGSQIRVKAVAGQGVLLVESLTTETSQVAAAQ